MGYFRVWPTSRRLAVSKMLHFKPALETKYFLLSQANILKLLIVRRVTRIVFFKAHQSIINIVSSPKVDFV